MITTCPSGTNTRSTSRTWVRVTGEFEERHHDQVDRVRCEMAVPRAVDDRHASLAVVPGSTVSCRSAAQKRNGMRFSRSASISAQAELRPRGSRRCRQPRRSAHAPIRARSAQAASTGTQIASSTGELPNSCDDLPWSALPRSRSRPSPPSTTTTQGCSRATDAPSSSTPATPSGAEGTGTAQPRSPRDSSLPTIMPTRGGVGAAEDRCDRCTARAGGHRRRRWPLAAGDRIEVLGLGFSVLEVPGHTAGHIAYYTETPTPPAVFATRCSHAAARLFEGHSRRRCWTRWTGWPYRLPARASFYVHEYTAGEHPLCAGSRTDQLGAARTRAAGSCDTRARRADRTVDDREELATNLSCAAMYSMVACSGWGKRAGARTLTESCTDLRDDSRVEERVPASRPPSDRH